MDKTKGRDNMKQATCEERVKKNLDDQLDNLRKLWDLYCEGEESDPDLGTFDEYGLWFDYIAPDTYDDQDEGWFVYQLSTGGPGDEFRFFVNPDLSVHRIEYWFLDWFDGASRRLYGTDYDLLEEIYTSYFFESGTAQCRYDEATS